MATSDKRCEIYLEDDARMMPASISKLRLPEFLMHRYEAGMVRKVHSKAMSLANF